MAEKLHKLAALRLLSDGLSGLEDQHAKRIARGDRPADVDREVAQAALNGVITFFQAHHIQATPLVRLLSGLDAVTAGSSLPAMFAPAVTSHRRPGPPTVEAIKGRLAAIMEYRQQSGLSRKEAGAWVVRNLPPEMKRRLGSVSRATVDSWLAKWGGKQGAPGSGREGYWHMRVILSERRPTEQQLKKIMETLTKSLPS